jgi:hypothetical protein
LETVSAPVGSLPLDTLCAVSLMHLVMVEEGRVLLAMVSKEEQTFG